MAILQLERRAADPALEPLFDEARAERSSSRTWRMSRAMSAMC